MKENELKIRAWVLAVAVLAIASMLRGWELGVPFPGQWALASFVLVAFLLERTSNQLRLEASGSTSFVTHMAAGILFGAFWGGAVAGLSTLISQLYEGRPWLKVTFNTAQRMFCVAGGMLLVALLGGGIPLFEFGAPVHAHDLKKGIWLFSAFAVFYFAVNATAVTMAVSLSTGRRFADVWNLNEKGVLGYDFGASFLSVLFAWLYVRFDEWLGLGALGFVLALMPVLVIRHIYGLYRRLQNSGRELLDLMVKAIEARDPYTSGHSVRVATLSKAVAHEIRMTAEQAEEVFTAALLHDVGKIHEEFAPLLRKESKLTPEETALLQTHSVKSAELVGIISSFRGVVQDSVRSHHERWDGGGYPDGRAGDDVPIGARIIMIADTADAMMTDRPYRKRLSIEAVVTELQKYRGTQFDPKLVDLVVNSLGIRRLMAELQVDKIPEESGAVREGGSKRVSGWGGGVGGGRRPWARLKAF